MIHIKNITKVLLTPADKYSITKREVYMTLFWCFVAYLAFCAAVNKGEI